MFAVPFNATSVTLAKASADPMAAIAFVITTCGVKDTSTFVSVGGAISFPSISKYFTGPYFSSPFAICFALPTITICIFDVFNNAFAAS